MERSPDDRAGDPLTSFYDQQLAEGVSDAQRVGWRSELDQRLRFEALLEAVHPADLGPGTRLLDAGCGLGDLYDYLRRTGRAVDYTGIDVHPDMIAEARRRFPEARFEVADLASWTERHEVVVGAGLLGVQFADSERSWRLVEQAYAAAEWVAALNLFRFQGLSDEHLLRTEYWAVDRVEAFRRLQAISPCLAVREDGHPADLVVYLYRGGYLRSARGALRDVAGSLETADLHLRRGRPEAALDVLGPEPPADPAGEAEWAFLTGVARAQTDDTEGAVEPLRRAHTLRPAEPRYAGSLGRLLLTRGEAVEAVLALREALAGGPPAARDELRGILHGLHLRIGDADAARAVEEATESAGERALLAADRLRAAGDLDAAQGAVAAADAAHPTDLRFRLRGGELARAAGRPEDGLDAALAVLGVRPTLERAGHLAVACLERLAEDPEQREARVRPLRGHPVVGEAAARLLGEGAAGD